jgi:hypothetical protein
MSLFAEIASEMIDRQREAEAQAEVSYRPGGLEVRAPNADYMLARQEILVLVNAALATVFQLEGEEREIELARLLQLTQNLAGDFVEL